MELARRCFLSLVKIESYNHRMLFNGNYTIQNDGCGVCTFWANSDAEAIAIFNNYQV